MERVIGADPFVLYDKNSGYYYCYATSNISEDNKNFYIYKTKDLKHFEFVDFALDLNVNNWAKDWYWAPECYYNEKTGWYFLIYSARVKDELLEEYFGSKDFEEGCKIGIAKSRSPMGPFVNITNRPIDYNPYDPEYLDIYQIIKDPMNPEISYEYAKEHAPKGVFLSSIDANLFFDNDKIYLYFSRCCYKNYTYDKELNKFIEESNILGVELDRSFFDDINASINPTVTKEYKDKYAKNKDGFVKLINYESEPQAWENAHVNEFDASHGLKKNRRWSEGSTTIKKTINNEEKYIMFYSCNSFENAYYGVGIAFSDSPLGKYKKFDNNPIIHQIENVLYSTGHGDVISFNNEEYYVFHARSKVDEDRSIYACKFNIIDLNHIDVKDIHQCELIKG